MKYISIITIAVFVLFAQHSCNNNDEDLSTNNQQNVYTSKANKPENKVKNIKNSILITGKNESFKDYYPSGKLKTEGQFFDNKKSGKWVSYYENNEEKSIKNYKEGELDGYQKMDYSQILCMEGYFKDGLKIGT